MLKVDQYDYIRTAYRVYGKTIRQIARDTGHSRNTIKKALHSQFIGYRPRDSQPYPVLGLYLHIIDRWLKSDKESPESSGTQPEGYTTDFSTSTAIKAARERFVIMSGKPKFDWGFRPTMCLSPQTRSSAEKPRPIGATAKPFYPTSQQSSKCFACVPRVAAFTLCSAIPVSASRPCLRGMFRHSPFSTGFSRR